MWISPCRRAPFWRCSGLMVRARRPRSGSGPTLLTPDRGTITIAGRDVLREPSKVRSKIGLAGQSVTMDEYLSGLQNLIMIGRLYRFSRKDARRRGLQAHRAVRARRRCEPAGPDIFGRHASRLGLAASLVAAPPVLFLDEPTAGLDPERPRGLEGLQPTNPCPRRSTRRAHCSSASPSAITSGSPSSGASVSPSYRPRLPGYCSDASSADPPDLMELPGRARSSRSGGRSRAREVAARRVAEAAAAH
jgi:ABC transporter